MDRKVLIISFIVILLFITACARNQAAIEDALNDDGNVMVDNNAGAMAEETGNEITGGITEADIVDEELNVEDVDSDLNNLDNDLANW